MWSKGLKEFPSQRSTISQGTVGASLGIFCNHEESPISCSGQCGDVSGEL